MKRKVIFVICSVLVIAAAVSFTGCGGSGGSGGSSGASISGSGE